MRHHWFKNIGWKSCPLNTDKLIFIIFTIIFSWGVNSKDKVASHTIIKNIVLCLYTCTTPQRWECLNILYLNWVSSWQELGGEFHNTTKTGVVNMGWVSLPYTLPYTCECGVFITPCKILSMFFTGTSLPCNVPLWIRLVCIIFFSHVINIDGREDFMMYF